MTRRAWVGLVLLLATSSLACVGLGHWQWTRHVHRSEQVALITSNIGADPVPAAELLGPDLLDPVDPDDVWRPVELAGEWVADSGVQLRNRPVEGANASHSLALLRTEAGALVVVDRGWWRQGDDVRPVLSICLRARWSWWCGCGPRSRWTRGLPRRTRRTR